MDFVRNCVLIDHKNELEFNSKHFSKEFNNLKYNVGNLNNKFNEINDKLETILAYCKFNFES